MNSVKISVSYLRVDNKPLYCLNRLLEEVKTKGQNKYITGYRYDKNGNQLTKTKSSVNLANTAQPSLSIKTTSELSANTSNEYLSMMYLTN